jgi:hypothetical protein
MNKHVPMDSTLLSKLVHHMQLLGKETLSTTVELTEALLFEWNPNKLHFGSNKQWRGFKDTDGVAMILHCIHRSQAANGNHTCS